MKTTSNILRIFIAMMFISLGLQNATAKQAEPVKTMMDSMVFDYEHTLWGKDPAVPLEPLGNSQQSTLKDLSYYGVIEDTPLLSTERTIFVDSTYKVKLHTTKREELVVKDEHHSHIGVGLSLAPTFMTYNSDFGSGKVAFSPGFHVEYEHYVSRNLGFMVGANVSITTGKFSAKSYEDEYSFTDTEGDLLKFTYKVGEILEENKLVMLDVPMTLAYTAGHLFGHAGLKIGFPVKLKYNQTLNDCDFSCEIPYYNTTVTEALALGVGQKTCTYQGEFSSRPIMMMFTLDAGYKFNLSKDFDLAASIFLDKALYKIKMKAKYDENNVQYAEGVEVYDFLKTSQSVPAQLIQSSVLSGQQMTSGHRIAEGLGYTSVGLKITLFYNASVGADYYSTEEVEDVSVPQPQE